MDTGNGNNQNMGNNQNNGNGQFDGNSQYPGNNQYQGNNQYTGNNQYAGYNNGVNTPYQAPVGNGVPAPSNGLQIAGLVCGILGICFSCCCGVPGIILGIVGIICAVNGNKENKNGMGTAGLVCSIISLILGILMMIYFGVVYMATFEELMNSGFGYDYYY